MAATKYYLIQHRNHLVTYMHNLHTLTTVTLYIIVVWQEALHSGKSDIIVTVVHYVIE